VTFRIAGGQTHPVGSGQAPPGDRRFDASKCQPRTSPRSGRLHGDVPEGRHLSVLLPGATPRA
jgi:hypothetical protein